jgi:hypothetical protein
MDANQEQVSPVAVLTRAERLAALAEAHYQHSLALEPPTPMPVQPVTETDTDGGDVTAWVPPVPTDPAADEVFLNEAQRLIQPN